MGSLPIKGLKPLCGVSHKLNSKENITVQISRLTAQGLHSSPRPFIWKEAVAAGEDWGHLVYDQSGDSSLAFREKAVCSGGKQEASLMVLACQDEMSNRWWDTGYYST